MNAVTKTLPASWYHDPKVFQIERKAIFGSEWLYAGEEEDLKKVGDYLTFELAGYPIFILVGSDKKIRAFHNVCRHRASPLLTESQGCLKSAALTCRYHGWTYDLSGGLVQAPFCETEQLKKDCNTSLFEIQVGILNGLVFINLDSKAPPFAEKIRPIREEIEKSGYPMTEYTVSARMSNEGEFNWKVWVDGYQECYHCMTIHPILNKDFALKKYKIENKEGYSLHSCERKSESNMGGFSGLWLWAYPNLGLPCYEPCFYTLQVNPISPTRTRLNYRFRFKPTVSENARSEFIRSIEQITKEDISVCEQVQKNLGAGIFTEGYLNSDRENGVAYFHSLVRQAVQNAE